MVTNTGIILALLVDPKVQDFSYNCRCICGRPGTAVHRSRSRPVLMINSATDKPAYNVNHCGNKLKIQDKVLEPKSGIFIRNI